MQKENCSAKNWLHRLRRLSISRTRRKNDPVTTGNKAIGPQIHKDNSIPIIKTEDVEAYAGTRKSFRRNLKKMQTHVKKYVFRHNGTSRNVLDTPTSSQTVKLQVTINSDLDSDSEEEDNHIEVSLNESSSVMQPYIRTPSTKVNCLTNSPWYWGPLSRAEAEEKLQCTADGTFLVRDSASMNYLFSISFRTLGKTLHSRIDNNSGHYSLFGQVAFSSVYELIENSLKMSENGVYCYTAGRDDVPHYPVRFLRPLSRFTTVPTLRHLCRFVIRQCTNINDLSQLPLPTSLNAYLQEGSYF